MKQKTFFSSIKDFIIKYWYVLPVLLALWTLIFFCLDKIVILSAPLAASVATALIILLLLILILLPLTWIVLLANKKWLRCITSIVASIVIGGVLGALFLSVLFAPDNDPFGKNHPIPVNLEYNLPLTDYIVDSDSGYHVYVEGHADSLAVADIHDPNTYLSVRNDFLGGIYKYDFSYGPLPAGEIYLKCFEVTENIPLSDKWGLKSPEKKGRVEISQTKSFSKLVNQQRFTIYEGDWGDYYAARIEVWFKDAETGEEKKLLEKVYRVEGWQR